MNEEQIKGTEQSANSGTSACACSQLGKLHKWWLRKFKKSTGLLVDYGYARTPYATALIGLMNRGLIKFVAGFDGCGFVELTQAGIEAKNSVANAQNEAREDRAGKDA